MTDDTEEVWQAAWKLIAALRRENAELRQAAHPARNPGRTRAEVLAALGARLPSAHNLHDFQGYAHGLQEAIALVSQMADAPAHNPKHHLVGEPDCAPITEFSAAEATAKLVAEESERRRPIAVGSIVTCRGESDSTFTVMALGTSRALLVDSKGRIHGWEPLHKLLTTHRGN